MLPVWMTANATLSHFVIIVSDSAVVKMKDDPDMMLDVNDANYEVKKMRFEWCMYVNA